MTSGRRSKARRREQRALMNKNRAVLVDYEETQREPLGYYLIEDHGKVISCLRYYTEGEKQEIERLSKEAQTECMKLHTGKIGKCCILHPTTNEVWQKHHPMPDVLPPSP